MYIVYTMYLWSWGVLVGSSGLLGGLAVVEAGEVMGKTPPRARLPLGRSGKLWCALGGLWAALRTAEGHPQRQLLDNRRHCKIIKMKTRRSRRGNKWPQEHPQKF